MEEYRLNRIQEIKKRIFDIIISLIGVIMYSPIMIIIAIGLAAYALRDHWIYKLEGVFDKKPQNIGGRPDYNVGDRVKHARFGEGTVKDIKEGGRDYEVTVDFGDSGIKKMFASFAKLIKI